MIKNPLDYGHRIYYVKFEDGSFGIKIDPQSSVKSFEDFERFIDKDPILKPAMDLLGHLDHYYMRNSTYIDERLAFLDSDEFKSLSQYRKRKVRYNAERTEAEMFFEEHMMNYICKLLDKSNAERDEM